jgi:pimeloyl-ACP methyl ester carboxylesterase
MSRRFLMVAMLTVLSCDRVSRAPSRSGVLNPPSSRMVQVGANVALEVVDWGGSGPPLVFLSGITNTAHVFEDFAPAFTERYHVLGITRRGYGKSAATLPANDPDTMVSDLKTVLDSLGVASATFIGHSLAGDEMTPFAERFPDRCKALVYLDAAYDRSTYLSRLGSAPPPAPPPMIRTDSSSASAVAAYLKRVAGVSFPIAEILATSRFDSAGRYLGDVTPASLNGRLLGALRKPNWDGVRCRSLAIYAANDSTAVYVPYYRELSAEGQKQADATLKALEPVLGSKKAFPRGDSSEVIEMHGALHYLFLQRPTAVREAILAFLSRNH